MLLNLLLVATLVIDFILIIFILFRTIDERKPFSIKDVGKFAPLIFAYAFIYIYYFVYTKNFDYNSVFNIIYRSIKGLTFDYDAGLLSTYRSIPLLAISFYTTTIINLYIYFSVAISLSVRYLSNFYRCFYVKFFDHDVILDSEAKYVNSYQHKENKSILQKKLVIFGKLSKDEFINARNSIGVYKHHYSKKTLLQYVKGVHKRVNFISLKDDDDTVLKRISIFIAAYKENPKLFKKVYLYVNTNYENSHLFERVVDDSDAKAHIILFSQSSIMADKFINDHPYSSILDEKYIDYATGLIKNDVALSTIFIGYGQAGKALFKESLIHNNFFTLDDNKIIPCEIAYYLFDKKKELEDKNVNHYLSALLNNPEGDKCFTYQFIPESDVNSKKFYESIKKIVLHKVKKQQAFQIFVSFASDATNIDLAVKLRDKMNELNNRKIEYRIYCRIDNRKNLPLVSEDSSLYKNIIFFGDDDSIINHDVIVNMSLENLAMNVNYIYAKKSSSKEELWLQLHRHKRNENLSRVLNYRLKLNMLGLDYRIGSNSISKEEYLAIYNHNYDFPSVKDYKNYYLQTENKKPNRPILPRDILAREEHARWTNYMQAEGFSKMELKDIKYLVDDNGKIKVIKDDYDNQKHACIRTFDELDAYHQHNVEAFEKFGFDITDVNSPYYGLRDTYQYDYNCGDDIYEELTQCGYEIYRINKKNL